MMGLARGLMPKGESEEKEFEGFPCSQGMGVFVGENIVRANPLRRLYINQPNHLDLRHPLLVLLPSICLCCAAHLLHCHTVLSLLTHTSRFWAQTGLLLSHVFSGALWHVNTPVQLFL